MTPQRIAILEKELDDCWCDDGRGAPECDDCKARRAELEKLHLESEHKFNTGKLIAMRWQFYVEVWLDTLDVPWQVNGPFRNSDHAEAFSIEKAKAFSIEKAKAFPTNRIFIRKELVEA